MDKPRTMIFAAGRGTRMGTLTQTTPKPLLKVAGQTLLDLTLAMARRDNRGPFVVNAHHLGTQIAAHLANVPDVTVTLEDTLFDTGGGLKAALPLLHDGPVTTFNADAVFAADTTPSEVLTGIAPPPGGAVLVLTRKEQVLGHFGPGDFFCDAEGKLTRRGAAASAPYVYTGIQLIDPAAVLGVQKDVFSFNLVWDEMIAEERLRGVIFDGLWVDTGTPAGLELAEKLRSG
ncbi:MAG: nucleotidyltransferase family protein [Pseudomonadota bacterium]